MLPVNSTRALCWRLRGSATSSVARRACLVEKKAHPSPNPLRLRRPSRNVMKFSIYLAAFLPWGVLAPLNVIKLMLNAVSPTAHFWVPKETEQCQGACGIARMWAQLFWSLQFISALSFVYVHYHREQTGLVHMGIATKLVVGLLLLKAYASGVIHWPIGLGGPCLDWALALGFALELRSRDALAAPKPKDS